MRSAWLRWGGVCTALGLLAAPGAAARTAADLKVSFAPNVSGAPSTVTFTAHFSGPSGALPAPVRRSVTKLPRGMGIDVRGLRTCSLATIELEEPQAGRCPVTSLLGSGRAFAEVGLGGSPIEEHAPVTAVLGSVRGSRIVIYLDGEGTYPVTEQVISKATITGSPSSGQTFTIDVPPIPSTVGGPNASVIDFTMSIGRQQVSSMRRAARYYRSHHLPPARGLVLPSCRGRLRFPTKIYFADKSVVRATPTAPCPRR